MQVSVPAHKGLGISNKEMKYLIQKMIKAASSVYYLSKDISMAFNVIFVSFKCACNWEVIFYRNNLVRPAYGARCWQLSAIFVHYLENYL